MGDSTLALVALTRIGQRPVPVFRSLGSFAGGGSCPCIVCGPRECRRRAATRIRSRLFGVLLEQVELPARGKDIINDYLDTDSGPTYSTP